MVVRKPVPGYIPPAPASAPPPPPTYGEHSVHSPGYAINSSSPKPLATKDAEDGHDWWDDSDDEDLIQMNADDVPDSQDPYEEAGAHQETIRANDLPKSLQGNRRSPRGSVSVPDVADLGMGGLSVKEPGSFQSNNEITMNPFRQKIAEPQIDLEGTAAVWGGDGTGSSKPPPQISTAQFPKKPLSPTTPHGPTSGGMLPNLKSTSTYIRTQSGQQIPKSPPPVLALGADDPWRDAPTSYGKGKALEGRQKVPADFGRPSNFQAPPASNYAGLDEPSPWSQEPRGEPTRHQLVPHIRVPAPLEAAIPDVETPKTTARRQRNESYQIKHIRWYDANSAENPRLSPVLIQNANGPCPLLALVNALVLSTPSDLITPLLDTLRTREQVSLGLLLDAVFEELMSERRGGGAQNLPDVGELYSFLITLHTGMNVNPRFIPENVSGTEEARPGSFQDTREMLLYSTFSVPLIHGWIPPRNHEAFSAFQRLAPTYEDAQNMQFRELELEQKLQTTQLSDDEETLYIDLTSIKEFLELWPTELTDHGLEVIKQSMKPGDIAILFRNDHFSTLYKTPRTNQLMTLVTDAGYSTHDEIVWESLVDITGTNSELFSGDFKSVSHQIQADQSQQTEQGFGFEGEWTTVESKSKRGKEKAVADHQPSSSQNSNAARNAQDDSPPVKPPRPRTTSEQEDMDLALALQLQEEEDQRSRTEDRQRDRQREDELTQRYLSEESSRRPEIPPRRSNVEAPPRANAAPPVVPGGVSRAADDDGDEAPPPPYEQATAKGQRPYIPPTIPTASASQPTGRQSLYSQNSQTYGGPATQLPTRGAMGGRRKLSTRQGPLVDRIPDGNGMSPGRSRVGSGPGAGSVGVGGKTEEEDKCTVM